MILVISRDFARFVFFSSLLVAFVLLEGVKIITEALVKSVSYKDDKLEIKLKDGRVVG